jgi:phytoene dehydrogenase-like protein
VHVGGSAADVARVGREVHAGRIPDRPFVLLVQPSLFDPTRAPAGRHTAWAYCHVPTGSPVDMTTAIEAQVERVAPGFRDLVLARATHSAPQMEAHDANYVGGDINGGAQDLRQLFFRPFPQRNPWATPLPGVYLCSSSTPPGGGAHGMCGHLAARSALRREFGRRT